VQRHTEINKQLNHILWIGGSPCAGKSSITRILTQQYNLQTYHCDDAYDTHLKRAAPDKHPLMSNAVGMTWDQVWMRPVDILVTRELAFYREEFELVIEDLLTMPRSAPIIAEGASLLPECVAPLLSSHNHAIWIVPTEEFQLREYAQRDWVETILSQCRDPHQAWQNWMGRDAGFARAVAEDARARGMCVIEVDGSQSIEEHAKMVAAHFGLEPSSP
jgi:2-phosphoglycerate kinase